MITWLRWQINKLRKWWRSLFPARREKEIFTVSLKKDGEYDYKFKHTKAYADQRQKMPHNRRRKPSKAMKHLYQLG